MGVRGELLKRGQVHVRGAGIGLIHHVGDYTAGRVCDSALWDGCKHGCCGYGKSSQMIQRPISNGSRCGGKAMPAGVTDLPHLAAILVS